MRLSGLKIAVFCFALSLPYTGSLAAPDDAQLVDQATARYEVGGVSYEIKPPSLEAVQDVRSKLSPDDYQSFLKNRQERLQAITRWMSLPSLGKRAPQFLGLVQKLSESVKTLISDGLITIASRAFHGSDQDMDDLKKVRLSDIGREKIRSGVETLDEEIWGMPLVLGKGVDVTTFMITLGAGMVLPGTKGPKQMYTLGLSVDRYFDKSTGKYRYKVYGEFEKSRSGLYFNAALSFRTLRTSVAEDSLGRKQQGTTYSPPLPVAIRRGPETLGYGLIKGITVTDLAAIGAATIDPMLGAKMAPLSVYYSSIAYYTVEYVRVPLSLKALTPKRIYKATRAFINRRVQARACRKLF